MFRRLPSVALIALLCTGTGYVVGGVALADQAGATACANKLDQGARLIYDASAPTFANSTDPRDLVAGQTRSLVMAGKLPRAGAREAAEAASRCLVMLRQ
jgi:hypothetical protein